MNGLGEPGYRSEPRVAPGSATETFVALKLLIDNWRWADVPFNLRTGKRLPRRVSEIAIQFKGAPIIMFRGARIASLESNLLIVRIQPDEGISLRFQAKAPAPGLQLGTVKMEFKYEDYFGSTPATGYETLLYDCMHGRRHAVPPGRHGGGRPVFPEVARYLRNGPWPLPVDLVVWESLKYLQSLLGLKPHLDEPFLLFTVDGVFAPGALARFAAQARQAPANGALGVTTFQEDEKPLYVEVAPEGRVLSVGRGPSPYITADCYFFEPRVFDFEAGARAQKLTALRQFLAFLVEEGFPLWGIDIGPAVDVDHPGDVARAEIFLQEGRPTWATAATAHTGAVCTPTHSIR